MDSEKLVRLLDPSGGYHPLVQPRKRRGIKKPFLLGKIMEMTKSQRRKARKQQRAEKRARFAASKSSSVKIYKGDSASRLKSLSFATSSDFLTSFEWRVVRMKIIKKYGATCQCCGASPANGAVINVDHIKPRKTHPHLCLDENNLQILCSACNHGKSNWDSTDWRPAEGTTYDPAIEFLDRFRLNPA